jgi:hypothetical protein
MGRSLLRQVRTEIVPPADCANPETRSMIVRDGPLNNKKLLEMFTMLGGIPRECLQALFEEELEREAIKDAISQIESIQEFTQAASGPLPFKITSYELNSLMASGKTQSHAECPNMHLKRRSSHSPKRDVARCSD